MNIAATHQCLAVEQMVVLHACCFIACADKTERNSARECRKHVLKAMLERCMLT